MTGKQGHKSLEKIAEKLSIVLTEKQKVDEDEPRKIKTKEIIFDNEIIVKFFQKKR